MTRRPRACRGRRGYPRLRDGDGVANFDSRVRPIPSGSKGRSPASTGRVADRRDRPRAGGAPIPAASVAAGMVSIAPGTEAGPGRSAAGVHRGLALFRPERVPDHADPDRVPRALERG